MASQTVTLHLDDFDRHGTTRARWDGRWVEVEHGIPGETVRAEVVGGKRPRGRILEVLQAAPDRIWPPCPYFRDWFCGGCQWQQISYSGQLRTKCEQVHTVMREHGLPLVVTAVHALQDPWRYRSTAGIALGRSAGFRRHGSLAIVPLHDCPISHPLIGRLMASLNEHRTAGTLPDFRGRLRLDVRVAGPADAPFLQVLIQPTEPGRMPEPTELDALLAVLQAEPAVAGISLWAANGEPRLIAGEHFAPIWLEGRPIYLSAASFFQTNLLLLPELLARLRQEARPAGKRVADVYGGVGLFGLFLAEAGGEVVVIERDPVAVAAGEETARAWGLETIRFLPAPAEEALAGTERFEVVIVDPPRTGLTPPVLDALERTTPPLVLYVSCLAQSLARDLVRLTVAGYRVEALELFDFYPQTYHVELLAVLRRD